MPNWGNMVDPDQLIKEMLALKASLEDFAERMDRVEDALFKNQAHSCADCGYFRCDDHSRSV